MAKSKPKPAKPVKPPEPDTAPQMSASVHLNYNGTYMIMFSNNFGKDHKAATAFAAKLKELGVVIRPDSADAWD